MSLPAEATPLSPGPETNIPGSNTVRKYNSERSVVFDAARGTPLIGLSGLPPSSESSVTTETPAEYYTKLSDEYRNRRQEPILKRDRELAARWHIPTNPKIYGATSLEMLEMMQQAERRRRPMDPEEYSKSVREAADAYMQRWAMEAQARKKVEKERTMTEAELFAVEMKASPIPRLEPLVTSPAQAEHEAQTLRGSQAEALVSLPPERTSTTEESQDKAVTIKSQGEMPTIKPEVEARDVITEGEKQTILGHVHDAIPHIVSLSESERTVLGEGDVQILTTSKDGGHIVALTPKTETPDQKEGESIYMYVPQDAKGAVLIEPQFTSEQLSSGETQVIHHTDTPLPSIEAKEKRPEVKEGERVVLERAIHELIPQLSGLSLEQREQLNIGRMQIIPTAQDGEFIVKINPSESSSGQKDQFSFMVKIDARGMGNIISIDTPVSGVPIQPRTIEHLSSTDSQIPIISPQEATSAYLVGQPVVLKGGGGKMDTVSM